jgi:hypothetical protein
MLVLVLPFTLCLLSLTFVGIITIKRAGKERPVLPVWEVPHLSVYAGSDWCGLGWLCVLLGWGLLLCGLLPLSRLRLCYWPGGGGGCTGPRVVYNLAAGHDRLYGGSSASVSANL